MDLKTKHEERLRRCHEACEKWTGCRGFELMRDIPDNTNLKPTCRLYQVPCKAKKERREDDPLFDSYEMGCYANEACKVDWLDQKYVSFCLPSMPLILV